MITTWIAAAIAGWLVLILPAAAQTPTHPLAGKILDTRSGALTELADPALIPKLFPCGAITLLGEVHDNAAHHEMRATLIRSLQQGIDKTCGAHAYVLEHISADQQAGLDKLDAFDKQARRLATASDLFRFLDWDKSGWPAARIFATLIQEVVDSRRPILAGNPARDATRKVAKEGVGALDPQLARRLGLDRPLDAPLADDLLGELEASHCGLMPKSAFTNMAAAQRYRDAYMADVALDAAQAHGGAVIFAGNGHVRSDRGVPYYLRQRAPGRKVITVAFVETEEGKTNASAYGPRDPGGKPAADYVAFALPAQREDPCEAMRKRMKN
jgi:uncharacterized iron-regulated protein